jgi:hypothetical protein
MKHVKKLYGLVMTFSLPLLIASCDQRDSQKKIGGSQDTSSVNKAGGLLSGIPRPLIKIAGILPKGRQMIPRAKAM